MAKREKYIIFMLSLIMGIILSLTPTSKIVESLLYDVKVSFYKNLFLKGTPPFNSIVIVKIKNTPKPEVILNLIQKAHKEKVRAIFFLFPLDKISTSPKFIKNIKKAIKGKPIYFTYYFSKDLNQFSHLKRIYPKGIPKNHIRGYVLLNSPIVRKKRVWIKSKEDILFSVEAQISSMIEKKPLLMHNHKVKIGNIEISSNSKGEVAFIPIDSYKFDILSLKEFIKPKRLGYLKGKVLLIGWDGKSNYVKVAGLKKEKIPYFMTVASLVYTMERKEGIYNIPLWANLFINSILLFLFLPVMPLFEGKRVIDASILTAGGYIFLNIMAFYSRINIYVLPFVISVFLFSTMIYIYRYIYINKIFPKFIPEKLLLHYKNIHKRVVVKRCAVLFADIKGYTTLSERYPPAVIMDLLNEYIGRMSKVIEENEGIVVSYQGDGLMAIFGWEEDEIKAAWKASKCALMMQEEMKHIRREWKMEHRELFVVGIGISFGDVALGTLGNNGFIQFTAIGDKVNVASRLQTLAKSMKVPILIDENVHKLVKKRMKCTPIKSAYVKGKLEGCKVYQLHGYKFQKIPTHPGIEAGDDYPTIILKKIAFYQRVQEVFND